MISGLFFYLFALVLIASAVGVVCARQPVHAVLFLILAFFNAAGLFLTLGAEFLAFILMIVYIGAVAVLFLFVVMMLDVRAGPPMPALRRFGKLGLSVGALLGAQMITLAALWPSVKAVPAVDAVKAAAPNTESLGRVLYTDYFFVFQGSGLILLVAIIGAIVLTLGPRRAIKRQDPVKQLATTRADVVELRSVQTGEGAE